MGAEDPERTGPRPVRHRTPRFSLEVGRGQKTACDEAVRGLSLRSGGHLGKVTWGQNITRQGGWSKSVLVSTWAETLRTGREVWPERKAGKPAQARPPSLRTPWRLSPGCRFGTYH